MASTENQSEKAQAGDVERREPSNPILRFFHRIWLAYEYGLSSIILGLMQLGRWVGTTISEWPVVTLIIFIVASLLMIIPFNPRGGMGSKFRYETSADVLWVPQTGKARDDSNWVSSNYASASSVRGASFYASVKPSMVSTFGSNALTYQVTWEMFQIHNKVMNISISYNGTSYTFSDLCVLTPAGQCQKGGYLNFWGRDFNTFVTSINGSPTDPTVGSDTLFRPQISALIYPDGTPVSFLSVYGGSTFSFNPTLSVTTAQIIASDYTFRSGMPADLVKSWQVAFQDILAAWPSQAIYTRATYISGASVGEELGKSINNDIRLVIISVVVFFIIAVLLLSKWDSVLTRTSLAILGVTCSILGILDGWGWGVLFGMPFTPLQQLAPFILIGVGVDVLFILIKAYDIIIERDPTLTINAAMGQLMATAGVSVQVTLLCSAVAFALGAVTPLPSIAWFSAFAALNIMFILAWSMLLFIACFVCTERRIRAGFRDFCCCPPCADNEIASVQSTAGIPLAIPVGSNGAHFDVTPKLVAPIAEVSPWNSRAQPARGAQEENFVKYLFRVYYAPFITKWWVKIIVILIFLAFTIVSAIGIGRMTYGQPLADLAPDGSYIIEYDTLNRATYQKQVGDRFGLYFRNLDFTDPVVQGKMLSALGQVLNNGYVNSTNSAFQGNWYINFNIYAATQTTLTSTGNCVNPYFNRTDQGIWAGIVTTLPSAKPITGCVPQAQFNQLLYKFLALPGNNQYLYSFALLPGYSFSQFSSTNPPPTSNIIRSTNFPAIEQGPGDDDKFTINFITSIRSTDSNINKNLFTDSAGSYSYFSYGSLYLFNEGDSLLNYYILEYFLLALAGILVVCLLLLVHPLASFILVCHIGLVDLFLFGLLWIVKIRFNQVSVINMIMATGLAVDYSVYVVQKFMVCKADGTRNGRVQVTLADTGSAIFLGGISCLIGAIPMAAAKSVIIRTFFRMIFATIVFSMAVGLILLPVILSLIGPLPISGVAASIDSHGEVEKKKKEEEDIIAIKGAESA